MIKDNFINNPNKKIKKISINFAGRSGSFFLQNLLEGHENIMTFQSEYDIYLYNLAKKFFLSNEDLNNYSNFLRKNLNICIHEHSKIFNAGKLYYNIDKICDEIDDIITKTKYKIIEKNFDFLIDVFFISHCFLNQKYININDHYILIHTHTPFNKDDYIFFENNLNIHTLFLMLRDPVKAIDSHLFHHTAEHIVPSKKIFLDLLILFAQSFVSINVSKKNTVFVIFYENLHNNTSIEIDKICERLDIKNDNILFTETIGRDKLQNQFISNKEVIYGFRKFKTPESLKVLNDYQVELIEFLFIDIIKKFNYKLRHTSISCIILFFKFCCFTIKDNFSLLNLINAIKIIYNLKKNKYELDRV